MPNREILVKDAKEGHNPRLQPEVFPNLTLFLIDFDLLIKGEGPNHRLRPIEACLAKGESRPGEGTGHRSLTWPVFVLCWLLGWAVAQENRLLLFYFFKRSSPDRYAFGNLK